MKENDVVQSAIQLANSGYTTVAALSGFVFLGERLSSVQCLAIACVITASIGATATAER